MRPLAVERDANAIAGREDWSCLCANLSRRVSEHVLRKRDIRFGDTLTQTTVNHRFRAACDFFRRLEQRDEGSTQRLPGLGEEFGRTQQTRHMCIMTAGMCDVNCVAAVINCSERRSVRQACVFPDRERVHISSRKYGLPFTIHQDANDSCTTNSFEDFVAEPLKFCCSQRGRLSLLKTQLWVRVYLFVNAFLPCRSFPQTCQNLGD